MARADGRNAHPGTFRPDQIWIFERKFDGIRLLAFKQGAEVRLLSQEPAATKPPGGRGGDWPSSG